VELTYSGQVTTVNDDGTTTVEADAPWLGWSVDHDLLGRVAREWTPTAAAWTGALDAGTGAGYTRGYAYDRAGRLVKVIDRTAPAGAAEYDDVDLVGTVCATREYGFDRNGNRTSLTRTGANPDGSCAATGGTTRTWAYDTADRITGGYTYDPLGRATVIPAADSPAGQAAGDLALGYYDTDQARTVTQSGVTTEFTLDSLGRRAVESTGPTGAAPTRTLTRHYTDTGDNPAWVEDTAGGVTAVTRYVNGLGGRLAATITTGGADAGTRLTVVDPHGDTPTTITLPGAGGTATGIDAWTDTDEYGNPTTGTADTVTQGVGYGWLGARERATTEHGLILMGARLYNRTAGAFTSTDPVYGGNSTAYTYPQDPINASDLTGEWGCSWCKKLKKKAKKAWKASGTAARYVTDSKWGKRIKKGCSYAWGAVSSACGAVNSAAYARQGRWKEARNTLGSAVLGGGVAKAVRYGYRRANPAAYATRSYRRSGHRFYRSAAYYSRSLHGFAASKAYEYKGRKGRRR
jgi:RHS repeat-associated protein